MPLQATGGSAPKPPKKKTKAERASQQFEMTMQVAGTEKAIEQSSGEGTFELVTGSPAPKAPKASAPEPKPGPWESGAREGRWVQGAEGKWKLGAEGQWVQDGRSEFKETYSGNIGRGGGGRAGGGNRLVGSEGTIRNFDGSTYSAGSANTVSDVTPRGGGGPGGGGAGGTGSPLAAAGSAVRALGLQSARFEGQSVEEVTRGARKTRKPRARRAE